MSIKKEFEKIERPDEISGATYKVKPPCSDHAYYVTINHVVMFEGTSNEYKKPYEIFINYKGADSVEWIALATRMISALFQRLDDDYDFIIEEMEAIFSPTGGYFAGGGKTYNGLVHNIGDILKSHIEELKHS